MVAFAGLWVNVAKGTYRFEVSGGVEGRVEKQMVGSGGCGGPGAVGTKTISEEWSFTLGGPSPEGKIEFRDLPLPSGPTALSGTRPLPWPDFFTIDNPFGGSGEGIGEATVSWTFSPLGDR